MIKYAIFAFKGELMCFIHVLLNAIELAKKGKEAKIIIEGEAVTLIEELEKSGNPLFKKAKEMGLIDCVCKACSAKMGALEYNEKSDIPLCDEMSGHPSMNRFIDDGYRIITL